MSGVVTTNEERAYEAPISSSDDLVYQSVSRSAVASLLLAFLGSDIDLALLSTRLQAATEALAR